MNTPKRLRLALSMLAFAAGLRGQQAATPKSEDCAGCHDAGPRVGKRQPGMPPGFNAAALKASPHATLDCTGCHNDITEVPHADKLVRVECGKCHTDEQGQYAASVHGKKSAQGDSQAPGCKSCQGAHNVLRPSNPVSPHWPATETQ